ncbi:MAG: MBL fold metallo-hydrolase, partial [Pseudomonadota bacterium]
RDAFVKMRTERDATLKMPGLIIPSLQVNMRAGEVPTDEHGNMMMKLPVNKL